MKKIILVSLFVLLVFPIVSNAMLLCIAPATAPYDIFPVYGGQSCDKVISCATTTRGGSLPDKYKCIPSTNISDTTALNSIPPITQQTTITAPEVTPTQTVTPQIISTDNSEQIKALQAQLIQLLQQLITLLNLKASQTTIR